MPTLPRGPTGSSSGRFKTRFWLVEREPRYTSCILSSLVLTGQRTIDSLRYAYDTRDSQFTLTGRERSPGWTAP